MSIEDPRIEALKASGIPDGAYLQEDMYSRFKQIGEYAAPEAIKFVHSLVLGMDGDLTASNIEALTESIAEAIAEALVREDVCDYSNLPKTQDAADEDAAHVEYEGEDV
jgi:hypothetical protein